MSDNFYVKGQDLSVTEDEKYWLEVLSKDIEMSSIYSHVSAEGKFNKMTLKMSFPEDIGKKILSISGQSEYAAYILLLSGVEFLLLRYSNSEDIIIGTPAIKNETCSAFFDKNLVFRNHVKYSSSFKELLIETKRILSDINKYQKVSFPKIQKIMGGDQFWLNFKTVVLLDNIQSFSNIDDFKADAIFKFNIVNGLIECSLIYNSVIINELFAEQVVKHLISTFRVAINNPDVKLAEIDIIPQEELHRILYGFNCLNKDYPMGESIIDMLEKQAEKRMDQIAVVYENDTVTYKELLDKAKQLSTVLMDKGVTAGSIVGICMERSIDMIIGIVGILKAGGAYMPILPDYPEERIRYMVYDSNAKVLLTNKKFDKAEGIDIELIHMEGGWELKENAHIAKTNIYPEDLAYIIYTSGSTGIPKGVMISQRNVINLVTGLYESVYRLYEGNLNVALIAPYVFDASVQQIFASLLLGHKLCIAPEKARLDSSELIRFYSENAIDLSDGTPVLLKLLLKSSPEIGNRITVKHFIIGGEVLPVNVVKGFMNLFCKYKPHITNIYGPTECCVDTTAYLVDPETLETLHSIPIGKPLANQKVYILGSNREIVPAGVIGEIYIGGDGVGKGYLNNHELTEKKFIRSPFYTHERLYKTGDLGRWLQDGNIEFIGRMDNQVKIRGYRIELGEIENRLLNFRKNAMIETRYSSKHSEGPLRYCTKCLLPSTYPGISYNDDGVCNHCCEYESNRNKIMNYFSTIPEFCKVLDNARSKSKSDYDCLLLYSGGKDSSYVLYKLVDMGFKVLTFTFDNGYISETAFRNIKTITSMLHVDNITLKAENMDQIYYESLKSDHTVCTGCFKALTAISTRIAYEKGINVIITGLSRGQILDTKLQGMYQNGIFDIDEIEKNLVLFRKMYHLADDRTSQLLNINLKDGNLFDYIHFLDYFRYDNISTREIKEYLKAKDEFWSLPQDTGFCSTNCLINDVGIHMHLKYRGYHNYASPLSWDCRLGLLSREDGFKELEDNINLEKVHAIYEEIGYKENVPDLQLQDAIVVDRTDRKGNKYLCAYIVTDHNISLMEIREYLSQFLPEYMIPLYFIKIDKIPLTSNGKVDRKKLPEPNEDLVTGLEYQAPANVVEEKILEIWQEILERKNIGVNDNFLLLGGDSLKAVELLIKVYKIFNVEIALSEIFRDFTIRNLAMCVEKADKHLYARIEPAGNSKYYPVSSGQKRMYIMDFASGSNTSYNVPVAVLLQGILERDRLENAFNELIRRHEPLRTSFVIADGQLVQEIQSCVDFRIDYIESSEDDLKNTIHSCIKSFDLSHAPLFRVCLIKISNYRHILFIDMHHIVTDGISMGILVKDFLKLYNGEKLAELSIQYKDYAVWQRTMENSEIMQNQEKYWINEVFHGKVPVLNLPTDFPRPVSHAYKGDILDFNLGTEIVERINNLAKQTGSTLFTVFHAVLNVLLYRFSGQEDIVIGSPVAGRMHPDLGDMIGIFINTVAIRNYPKGEKCFNSFLEEVRTNTLKAFENQDYQFENLVERLNAAREPGRNPLFDVMLVMQNTNIPVLEIGGLRCEKYEFTHDVSKFDLLIEVENIGKCIHLAFQYDSDLFRRETIERFGKEFIKLTTSICENWMLTIEEISGSIM